MKKTVVVVVLMLSEQEMCRYFSHIVCVVCSTKTTTKRAGFLVHVHLDDDEDEHTG